VEPPYRPSHSNPWDYEASVKVQQQPAAHVDREDFEDELVEEEDDIDRKIEDRLNRLSPMPSASPKMRKEKVKQAAKKPSLKIPEEQVEQWGQDEEESKQEAGIIEHNFQSEEEEEDNFHVYHEH
jgi:hypothetical protein